LFFFNQDWPLPVPNLMMNFMPEGGTLHPFIRLYARSAADCELDMALYLLRSALAGLLPEMSNHQLYLSTENPGYKVPDISIPESFKKERNGLDFSFFLPYHQHECAGLSLAATNLQPWAGLEQALWLIWSKKELIPPKGAPDATSIAIAAQVLSDFANYSLALIRRDTEHKFIYLTGLLGSKKKVKLVHTEVKSLVKFELEDLAKSEVLEKNLASRKIIIKREGCHFSVANYPVHSKEAYYSLIDQLDQLL
jgi:hypothetical protein